MPASVAAEKIEGLRQLLARDGAVTFKSTGATVRRDPEWAADLLVEFPDGATRRVNEFAHDQFGRAYAIASTTPEPPAPPPQVFKPTRSRRDFGECPF